MNLRFTKMQGAGNDFVVIDATRSPLALTAEQARHLGDRRFGVGADQILIVEAAPSPAVDFRYRIFNSSGEEVEHCGNGARCFLRFVRAKGLTTQRLVRVQTMNRVLELREGDDGRVTVDMGAPVFDLDAVPFDGQGLQPVPGSTPGFPLWPLALPGGSTVDVAVLSMGNPHAVQRVDDVDTAPVATVGPLVERHVRFPQRVNASFLQVLSRSEVRLRVFERGAGETLACGTGACAAVVAGIRLGWLDACVEVQALGGRLTIEWAGAQRLDAPVLLTGPAEFVFEGEIEL
jgi:diaminopimelate epimerase